jgi:hypothetical protein
VEKIDNEEFIICTLLCISNMIKSKKMRWTRHVVCMGQMRNVDKILTETEENSLFGTARHR